MKKSNENEFSCQNYIKTCQPEQVNNFLQRFFHAKRHVNNFQASLLSNFTRGREPGYGF